MPLITPPNLNRCLSSSVTDSKTNKNMHECNLYENATIPLTTINQPNCHISTNAVRQLKINKLMQTDIQPETWCVQMLNRYASELDQLLWLDYPQGNPTIIQRIKILGTKWYTTLQELWSLLRNRAFYLQLKCLFDRAMSEVHKRLIQWHPCSER